MAAGVLLAVLAALAYEGGYVLQALAARRVARVDRPGAGLLASLVRRPVFGVGVALGGVGFVFQVLALRDAPLAIVQPILALGLIALLVLARVVLGERPGRREFAGAALVAAGAGGTVALASTAEHAAGVAAPVVVGVLALIGASPLVLRLPRAWWLVVATASADVVVALAGARIGSAGSVGAGAIWLLLAAVAGILSLTDEGTALQRLPAVRVGPVILAAQVVVPVLLAGVVAGQELARSTAGRVGLVASLAVLAAGVALLASSEKVANVIGAEPALPATGPQA